MGLLNKALVAATTLAIAGSGCMRDNTTLKRKYLEMGGVGVRPLLSAGLDGDTRKHSNVAEIYDTPDSFRLVPRHKGDMWSNGWNAPIPDDSALLPEYRHSTSLFKAGLEFNFFDKVGLEIYGGLDGVGSVDNYPSSWDDSRGEVNERNYTNKSGTDTRGSGAALTYWAAKVKDGYYPRLNADLIFKLHEGKLDGDVSITHNLFFGAGIVHYDVEGLRGYDRWDRLEKLDTHKLGEVTESEIYGGYRLGILEDICNFSVRGGVRNYDFDGVGETKVRFNEDEDWFLSVGAEFRL